MKDLLLICLSVFLLVTTGFAGGVTLDPGDERLFTQSPADDGTFGNNGNITFILLSAADANAKTIKASSTTTAASIGTGTATSQIYYEFVVGSTPETAGNTVGAWISYVADWTGFQQILAVGTSNSSVEIELVLRDMTTPSNLHIESVHQLDLKTHKVKAVLIAGFDFDDSGLKATTFPAVLKRGHTYRLTFRMSTSVFLLTLPITGSMAQSTYMSPTTGVRLLSLNAKLGLDEKEVLERLEGIENHRHIYLTGRGLGHNNTQATSSLPLFGKPVSPKLRPERFLDDEQVEPAESSPMIRNPRP